MRRHHRCTSFIAFCRATQKYTRIPKDKTNIFGYTASIRKFFRKNKADWRKITSSQLRVALVKIYCLSCLIFVSSLSLSHFDLTSFAITFLQYPLIGALRVKDKCFHELLSLIVLCAVYQTVYATSKLLSPTFLFRLLLSALSRGVSRCALIIYPPSFSKANPSGEGGDVANLRFDLDY